MVVIFYSGHGGQVARTPTSTGELDDFDETLILRDGTVTDDELSAALEGLRAGTLILAFDSCNSGGFAMNAVLGGRNGNGVWTLRFVDQVPGNVGSVSAATLSLAPSLPSMGSLWIKVVP